MTPALAYERISKSFFGVPALQEVSFALPAGHVLGLVGENGAGKSTLMNILGGVLPPDQGRLLLAGQAYAPASPREATARGVAFIHQELNLFPNLSIAENIFLTAFPRKAGLLDRRAMRARTEELLRAVQLDVSPDALVETLSPGERQLVEIAKALAGDARVVIFDEPTTSLTARESERLFALIERLRDEGRSMIYISHALGDVMRLADDVVVLRDGAVVASGLRREFTIERMISLMVGRSLEQLFPARSAQVGEPLLQVTDLGQPGVIEGIGFTLHAGEVLGIAGLMGSGRTELVRILFGLEPHGAGEIRLRGRALRGHGPAEAIARGMALLTENRREEGLLLDATMTDNAALAALRGLAGPGGWVDRPRLEREVAQVCRAVRASDGKRRPGAVKTLSGGNQQKVVLAKWLLTAPSVFILDEPTRGIDVGAKQEIYRLVNQLCERGAGVLLVSSELEELLGMCDRLLVMRRGEIAGTLPRRDFDREAILRLALAEGQAS